MALNCENNAEPCKRCNSRQRINVENALDYHEQIERLQAELKERKIFISQIDKNYADNVSRYEADVAKSQEEYAKLKYRHEALLEAFKTQQRVNSKLEDKLINVVSEMAKRYETLEARCKTLASNLETANKKIAELTAENFDQDDEAMRTPDNVNRGPVSFGFGSGVFPLYHSSPDLCGMANKQRQRNTCPAKKQTYSPFAIQTFPPTLMCDTSSYSDTLPRVRTSDGGPSDDFGNTIEEDTSRSKSNMGTYSCPYSSQVPVSQPPMFSTIVNERADDTSFDLKTHRTHIGSVFTI